MRKIFVFIVGLFMVGTVFAVGENVPTSKSYVDTAIAQKQDTIPANAGAAQVLTNTGTPGNVNTKNIYDSSADYAGQTDALVTAGTMNAAVQNAIETEFKCISWVDNDPSKECLLLELRAVPRQSALPAGYTQLEYLQSTGEQYINTGIIPDIDMNFEITFSNLEVWIMGSVASAGKSWDMGIHSTQIRFGTEYAASLNLSPGKYTVKVNKNGYNVNGIQTAWNSTPQFLSAGYPIYLFWAHNSIAGKSGKIYMFNVSNATGPIANFIPARRDSDGVLGMYDTVTNTFFTNAGSGTFVAGPVVYMPAGN